MKQQGGNRTIFILIFVILVIISIIIGVLFATGVLNINKPGSPSKSSTPVIPGIPGTNSPATAFVAPTIVSVDDHDSNMYQISLQVCYDSPQPISTGTRVYLELNVPSKSPVQLTAYSTSTSNSGLNTYCSNFTIPINPSELEPGVYPNSTASIRLCDSCTLSKPSSFFLQF